MPVELNKCPNCNGKLEVIHSSKRLVCSFCGSEFALDEQTQKDIGDHPISKDWFIYEWDYKKLSESPKTKPVISSFVRGLNEYDSASALENYMRDYLMGFDEISANSIREDKMKGIVDRLSGSFQQGERVILYNDDGIFVHGKTGVVVTDKRTFFVEKKSFKDILHTAVPYINFGYSVGLPDVKLGEKYSNNIGTFNSHYDLQGTVAALICMLAFENRADRPKIRLTGTVD